MLRRLRRHWYVAASTLLLGSTGAAMAAAPAVDQALKLSPIQKDVEYDIPSADEAKQCTVKGEKQGDLSAWVVRDAAGQVLRRFADTNGDNVVDLWCYYRDGLEVYRDIDQNFNGKADQYRWLNTGGSRWGLDENEDGKIDSWKIISAEEVSLELVRALAEQDATRFSRLVMTDKELASLGLGSAREKELAEMIKAAPTQFTAMAKKQKGVTAATRWINFGATRPGIVPAGTEGSTKDLLVYEHVLAMVETAGKHDQVQVGTLVRVGDVWRLVASPATSDAKTDLAESGIFFQAPAPKTPAAADTAAGAPTGKSQQLLADLEALDKQGEKATTPEAQARYNAKRADLLEQLADEAANADDRKQWLQQLADSASAATQSGSYPEGVARLKSLCEKLAADSAAADVLAYVKFRYLSAEYSQSLQAPNPDFPKIQTQWLADLEKYVAEFPNSPDAAEAMLQLGVAQEFAGQEDDAKKWYGKVVSGFPNAGPAKKAGGAIKRLESVGQSLRLSGKNAAGQQIDISQYKGKLVLVHYWATWCEPCVKDMESIKEMYARYGASGFAPLGVNLDSSAKTLADFVKANKLNWHQLHEPGSLDGRLANELGILTLPTMLLVDRDGRVINRNISISEVESELKKRATGSAAGSGTARKP